MLLSAPWPPTNNRKDFTVHIQGCNIISGFNLTSEYENKVKKVIYHQKIKHKKGKKNKNDSNSKGNNDIWIIFLHTDVI